MYNHNLKIYGEMLASAQALPASATTEAGNGGAMDFRGTMGSLEVLAVVNAEVIVPAGKRLTVHLEESDDGITYASLATLFDITAGATETLPTGTVLGRTTIKEGVKQHVRVSISVDDVGFTGNLDVIPAYLPR